MISFVAPKKEKPLYDITDSGETELTDKMGYGTYGILVISLKSMKELSSMVEQAITHRNGKMNQ